MSHYRRANTTGGTYFFTVVTYLRQKILTDEYIRQALQKAITETQEKHPFTIDAWILLPDHLHCLWTLPKDDANFSKRWGIIKRKVSLACANQYKNEKWLTPSKRKHRESTLWQRRFWEHKIRDENDFEKHVDYIHYNPVKHGLCEQPKSWPYSTIHRYIKEGIYPEDWAIVNSNFPDKGYGE